MSGLSHTENVVGHLFICFLFQGNSEGKVSLARSNQDYIDKVKSESFCNSPQFERKLSGNTLLEIERKRLAVLDQRGSFHFHFVTRSMFLLFVLSVVSFSFL